LETWRTAPDKLTGLGEFPLDRCRGCGSLVLHRLPARETAAGFYPRDYWYRESDQTWLSTLEWRYRRWVLKDHVGYVGRFLPSPAKVLEVGCSSGTFLYLLKRQGVEVLGLDFSKEAAAEAKSRYAITVLVGSLKDHADELRRWAPHAVCMFHVLEHLVDPLEELRLVHSILWSRGQLFLQVPNMDSWQAELFGARWYGVDVPRHVVNFTESGLRHVIKRAGFRIANRKHFSLRDNSPSWASSLFLSVDPLRRRLAGKESGTASILYAALVAGLQPVAALEAAFGHGGTLFVRATKASEEQ
jgi:2-polyprenyl-3-methyl-5-hydroxy-6-metoxy-1,4-benzoquinol methylase